jgi:hypothetical protein
MVISCPRGLIGRVLESIGRSLEYKVFLVLEDSRTGIYGNIRNYSELDTYFHGVDYLNT